MTYETQPHIRQPDNGWTQADAKLRAIIKAYDMVKNDPNAKIPTLLMAAIETARSA